MGFTMMVIMFLSLRKMFPLGFAGAKIIKINEIFAISALQFAK
jgi:hypothetical protein